MKQLFTILIFLYWTTLAFGQTVVRGGVFDQGSKKPISGANVMLMKTTGDAVFGYSMTDDNGEFKITYNANSDSIRLLTTGVGIKRTIRKFKLDTNPKNIYVTSEAFSIREVVVNAAPIRRTGDTINYTVSKFADLADRSISDVLRKMPGVEILASGQIKYNGKDINKFYIEDMDMLGGRYNIATTNISHKDIASVQVFENHQPISALRDKIATDQAALNLKLKDDVKGIWSGNLQVGAGYSPVLWNGEAVAMMFSKKFQTINTYKGNNEGIDISREFISHYDMTDAKSTSMLSIAMPYVPSINSQRHLDNRINSTGMNMMWKLPKDYELKVNANYVNDKQIFNGVSQTTYYIPGKESVQIDEQTYAIKRVNKANLELELLSNKSDFYFKENLKVYGTWSVDEGDVRTPQNNISQSYYRPQFDIDNNFRFIRSADKWTYNIKSINSFSTSPATLVVSPLLYPELFENGVESTLGQQLQVSRFHSITELSTDFTHGYFTHSYRAGFDAELNWLNSSLAPTNTTPQDSMTNKQFGTTLQGYVTPNFNFNYNGISAALNIPIKYQNLVLQDDIRNQNNSRTDLLVAPSFRFMATVTPSFKISVDANYNRKIGDFIDSYGGYIMNNYRSISNREGLISDNKMQNYSFSLNYGNAFLSLFGSLRGSYWRNNSNLMYDTKFFGTLSQIKSYAIENRSQGYSLYASSSKRFEPIRTTFTINANFNKAFRPLLRENAILNTTNDVLTLGGELSTSINKILYLEYSAAWTKSLTKTFDSEISYAPIEVLTQKAGLNFIFVKNLFIRFGGEHFYNNAISDGSRNIFFLDASVRYRAKTIEYMLEGRNLLDTKQFYNAVYGEAMGYRYIYDLRPASVIFKVKFYFSKK